MNEKRKIEEILAPLEQAYSLLAQVNGEFAKSLELIDEHDLWHSAAREIQELRDDTKSETSRARKLIDWMRRESL